MKRFNLLLDLRQKAAAVEAIHDLWLEALGEGCGPAGPPDLAAIVALDDAIRRRAGLRRAA